jgi:hypothetical protein
MKWMEREQGQRTARHQNIKHAETEAKHGQEGQQRQKLKQTEEKLRESE